MVELSGVEREGKAGRLTAGLRERESPKEADGLAAMVGALRGILGILARVVVELRVDREVQHAAHPKEKVVIAPQPPIALDVVTLRVLPDVVVAPAGFFFACRRAGKPRWE